jgi:small subunit ribosomal protein S1/4-hydroxy-3-methylbut-2-enyl diphosphate reductase
MGAGNAVVKTGYYGEQEGTLSGGGTYKVGDSVKAFIKEINGDKIALSVKYPDQNPWNGADVKYAIGNVVKGKVARMTDFGAFIQLEDGIDALLHVSQISKEHVNKPSDVLSIGQEVEAKVVDFNDAEKKISLSVKALTESEEVESEEN